MPNISLDYNTRTKIKSQIIANLCDNEIIRSILDFKPKPETDEANKYDPDDPWSLVGLCIMPYLKKPETITDTRTLILVGVDAAYSYQAPMLLNTTAKIVAAVDDSNMLVTDRYIGCTRADWLADEIIKSVARLSGTWIGDVSVSQISEYPVVYTGHYAVEISLSLKDVNMAAEIQNEY